MGQLRGGARLPGNVLQHHCQVLKQQLDNFLLERPIAYIQPAKDTATA